MTNLKKLTSFFTAIITCLLIVAFNATQTNDETGALADLVKIETGLVSGTKSPDHSISIFKGIPFAAPPVGDLRWKAPQPVQPWQGVKKCDAFGPSPMQSKPAAFSMWSEEFLIPGEPISEDCLYLNLWTGAKTNKEKRPVLVWVYGGGFNSGGAGVPIYDGEALAKKGIVFVSFNYRVGVFGFFAHPELTKESPYHASGNYGLLDQVAALKWVQKNIAAFGGDPANVTIAGQSAGSMSVNCLVATPLAKGLFTKAIAESGANFSRGSATIQQAEKDGIKLAEKLNAPTIAGLRSMPADDLFKKAQGQRGVIIDGYVLPETIAEIFAARKQNDVALLTGWNQDEGLLSGPIKNATDFRKQVAERYGADSTNFLKHYPASTDAEAATSQLNLSRDMIFGAQNYTWANIASQQGKKVYVYRFTRKVPATGEYVKYGAFHTGEVPYAYNNLKFVNRPWQPEDHKLAEVMSSFWTNFIITGNPNGSGLPNWLAYTTKDKKIMDLGITQKAVTIPDAPALDFIAAKMGSSQ
ncbi:carboxylesterase family protein [Segetibacter sp.]|jgi:para-nitrobenzyl esterase|uniref:carboxylesterase/lipase family protein n=1 Tax=Segetibacter sp. TaxID=2231182 RepID=UPI002618C812|nr:carboxylesterase family protein [Segetibacter sp.]MCW3078690.1 carboxylesterase [Segetibacter sp.]